MLIYDVLKNDHVRIKSLLDEIIGLNEDASPRRTELIDRLRNEFIPHARAEEAVLYNSIRSIETAKDTIMHSYEEHIAAETLLRTLQVRDKVDMDWVKTAKKLRTALSNHIEDEENRIFNVAQQLFTNQEATVMAEAFQKIKPEVREEGLMKNTLDMVVNMLPPRIAASLRTYNVSPKA